MPDYTKILNGPDYFTCERYHCRMSKQACVRNQQVLVTPEGLFYRGSSALARAEGCAGCLQGIQIKAEMEGGHKYQNLEEVTHDSARIPT